MICILTSFKYILSTTTIPAHYVILSGAEESILINLIRLHHIDASIAFISFTPLSMTLVAVVQRVTN